MSPQILDQLSAMIHHRAMRILVVLVIVFTAAAQAVHADDATVLRWGDRRVDEAEEAFILAGRDLPLLERPALEGRLREELLQLDDPFASRVAAELKPARGPIVFSAATNLAAGYSDDPGRDATITPQSVFNSALNNTSQLAAYGASGSLSSVFISSEEASANGEYVRVFHTTEAMGAALAEPSVLDLRLRLVVDPFVLDFDPELRKASNWYRTGGPLDINYALFTDLSRTDVNVPYRGIATYLSGPFELRLGRDKLQLGPGRDSTLSFNAAIPWADYIKASADAGPVSVALYYVRLNPYLTDDERDYMDAVYQYPKLNADPDAYYELIDRDAEKNLAICRITWRICPWATLAFTQNDLVAGRSMQLSDFNPLIIWHNLFQEGVYGVPAMLEASVVPMKGLRLYGQYLLYGTGNVADENAATDINAAASGYQAGINWIMKPFAQDGAQADTRIRFDVEATYTDPWLYGKAYSLRQFTSRFIFVEPYYGRMWVDYPIGPSFGPDCADLDLKLSVGKSEGWDFALTGGYRISGSINLVGYGDGSDYSHQGDYHYDGIVEVLNGQSPETRLRLGLEASSPEITRGAISLHGTASLQGTWAQNYGFVPGAQQAWIDASVSVTASFGE